MVKTALKNTSFPKAEFDFLDNNNNVQYTIILTGVAVSKFSFLSPECPTCQKLSNEIWPVFQTIPDTNNYSGKTFYRLRVVDLEGNGTYSKVIEVDGYGGDGVFKVYPNPGSGVFFLQLPVSTGRATTDIQVFNAWGQVVFHTVLNGQLELAQLSLGHLSNGQYVVECRPKNGQPAHARIILLK